MSERDPCRKKRWKFPSFGFIFRAPTYSQASGFFVLLRGSEWLLLVPFYFTLIIPTLIAPSSRISFPRLHFHSLILLSLSLSLSLSYITIYNVLIGLGQSILLSLFGFKCFGYRYICGPFRNGQVTSYINSYIWWAACVKV